MNNPPGEPLGNDSRAAGESGEDLALIRAVLGGAEGPARSAFERLFEKYRERVFRVLLGVLRHHEDALEATQEVFLKAWRALGGFDPQARFYTWLYRIAVNQGIDVLRRRKQRHESPLDPELEPRDPPAGAGRRFTPPAEEAEWSEVRERLARALESLSEPHRTVFLLYSQEGLRYEEISDVLGVPVGTVMSRLFYARRKLCAELPAAWDPGGAPRRSAKGRKETT